MFDKVIFNARINSYIQAEYLIRTEHLQRCSEGDRVYYQSSALANINGISIKVAENILQVKCSLHKLFYKWRYGKLDNTRMFTMSDARETVKELFGRWDIDIGFVRVTYYEIGINIPVERDPLEYIDLVRSVGLMKNKEFFIDANFEKNRQKTTEKGRTIKKYFKIYDKSFETRSKERECEENILRVETVYRRQNIPLDVFLSPEYVEKVLNIFRTDWMFAGFSQKVSAVKGVRSSQTEKASRIMQSSPEEYLKSIRTEWKDGHLTDKQYRTMREFVQDWENMKHQFFFVADSKEIEYKSKFENLFETARK